MAQIRTPEFLGYEHRAYYQATDKTLSAPQIWTDEELASRRADNTYLPPPPTLDPGKTWVFFGIEEKAEVWDTSSTDLEPNDIGDLDQIYRVKLTHRDGFPNEIRLAQSTYALESGPGGRTLVPSHPEISVIDDELLDLR